MNLFLNCVSNNGIIILFDENRKIISEKKIEILGNESEKLIEILDIFFKENSLEYKELENIVVVAGPGSFTGIRTIVLMINTINFVINKNITSINYFDLFDNYPIIKSSSKRDSFFKKDKNSQIEIMKNEDILEYIKQNNITKIYGENKFLPLQGADAGKAEGENELENIFEKIDYSAIIKNIKFDNKKIIEPIYIKKPSIG